MTTPTLRRTGMVYARAAFEVAVLAAVRQPTHWDRTSVSLVPDPPPTAGVVSGYGSYQTALHRSKLLAVRSGLDVDGFSTSLRLCSIAT